MQECVNPTWPYFFRLVPSDISSAQAHLFSTYALRAPVSNRSSSPHIRVPLPPSVLAIHLIHPTATLNDMHCGSSEALVIMVSYLSHSVLLPLLFFLLLLAVIQLLIMHDPKEAHLQGQQHRRHRREGGRPYLP